MPAGKERQVIAPSDGKRRPSLRLLASPFALRAGASPANIIPNFLYDTSTSPTTDFTYAKSPNSPPRTLVCPPPGRHQIVPYYSHRSTPTMSSVRLSPKHPPLETISLSRTSHTPSASANNAIDAQDSQEEECQEGNPVLPDGLRRFWHWYASHGATCSPSYVAVSDIHPPQAEPPS